MSTDNKTKLKPCFCGRVPKIETRDVEPQEDRFFSGKVIMFVLCECGQCLFDGAFHEGFVDESEAITAWNYRATSNESELKRNLENRIAELESEVKDLEAVVEAREQELASIE